MYGLLYAYNFDGYIDSMIGYSFMDTIMYFFSLSIWQVIFYEQPKLASHHYSIRPWNFISQTSKPQEALAGDQMKADWVIKLEKHKESPDIASVSSLLLFDVFI